MHASHLAHRTATWWLAAIVGVALLLASPALSQAEESNPNNYNCLGSTAAGQPEAGSDEQQVQYTFYCNGPITGYQVQSQIPVTGVSSPPEVTDLNKVALRDTFSCSGEVPGWAANCVGAAKAGYEIITGQFAIGTKLCTEPRVDPLLTVTYAYLEKGVITQAISGPFDLGRPKDCKPDAYSGFSRFNPKPLVKKKHAKRAKKHSGKKKATTNKK
ncbi:MAG: hypothetical protein QOG40_293 [Solirubrobacteraceae bacterium]|nr:hypothetical protein [Solirubrobacteraceae bacterium]